VLAAAVPVRGHTFRFGTQWVWATTPLAYITTPPEGLEIFSLHTEQTLDEVGGE